MWEVVESLRAGDRPGGENGAAEPMRQIHAVVISPSEDVALEAQRLAQRMPRVIRLMLDGLGTPDAQSADLMSDLLFDSAYTRTLVGMGYRDADARLDELEDLIRRAPGADLRQAPDFGASGRPRVSSMR